MGVIAFSEEKSLRVVLIIAVCFTGCCPAGNAEAQDDSIIYTIEDFSSFVPNINYTNKLGRVYEEFKEINGENKKCIRMVWYDVRFPEWDSSKGWIFGFYPIPDKYIIGQLKSIRARIYTPEASVGISANFELSDSTGRVFGASTALSKTGWNMEIFPIKTDFSIKPPIRVVKFSVGDNRSGHSYILIEQFLAEVSGQPRNLVQCILKPGETDFFGGSESAPYRLKFINHSKATADAFTADINVTDTRTNEQIFALTEKTDALKSGQEQEIIFNPPIKYGQFVNIEWKAADAVGVLPQACGSSKYTRMFRDSSPLPDSPAKRAYLKKWGAAGGVFWALPPKRAIETGALWIREVENNWPVCETQKGRLDFSPLLEHIRNLENYPLDIIFASMFYLAPYYRMEELSFAPAYGWYNQALAKAFGSRIARYELHNETNGPDKYLYTEIARHGAAGLRSVSPDFMIGNAGTAGVAIGFLKMQAERGLFEYLDEVITHPYTTGPPEAFGFYEQCAAVDKLIDELGGMKFHYTTEWGYHHTNIEQDNRAMWIPRHFAIAAAAGITKHGLFAWDNHFGIYDNSRPYPAAVSVNIYCSLTRDCQFAGWLRKDDKVWAAVFECAGTPLIMAWSSRDTKEQFSISGQTDSAVVRDLYGNVLPIVKKNDEFELTLDGRPVYIEGLSKNAVLSAWQNSAKDANIRYCRVLEQSSLKDDTCWAELAKQDNLNYETIKNVLMSWQPRSSEVGYAEQAVIAQAIRRAILAARIDAVESNDVKETPVNGSDARKKQRDILARLHSEDIDVPSLRWVLTMWEKNNDEANMLKEAGKSEFASHLEVLDEIFNRVCDVLAVKGHRVFFPIWPYLHASKENDEKLLEHFIFTPGRETTVQMRLHSYASKAYKAKAYLELPEGWECEPKRWEGIIQPEKQINTAFQIKPGLIRAEKIYAVLSIEGKPEVKIPYDNFEIELPLEIESEVLESLIPDSPLMLKVTNRKSEPVSGKLRVLPAIDLSPLASTYIKDIKPGESRCAELNLSADTPIPAYNDWELFANFIVNDESITKKLTADFACAAKVTEKPLIDGNLGEWVAAPVIHIDKESYTDNSFGSGWSREDLSANVYMMWDSNNFYFAAQVKDQTFQQELYGLKVYQQDSIQIAFSNDDKKMSEVFLALTPKCPLVWLYDATHPSDNDVGKKAESALLAVALFPGMAVYECAIPWSEIFGISPAEGQKIRFDVLLNDDDVVAPRRYMFRFGKGIVHMKGPAELGYLRLLSESKSRFIQSNANIPRTSKIVFREDFEEYADGTMPDVWQSVTHLGPAPESIVRSGVGRNNSKALVLNNTVGLKPAVYRNLIRQPRDWQPGQKYELRAWVKGDGITGIGIASDLAGVQGFQYIPDWKPSNQWQLVKREIIPADGMYLIIRNETKIENLIIDDLEIASLVEP